MTRKGANERDETNKDTKDGQDTHTLTRNVVSPAHCITRLSVLICSFPNTAHPPSPSSPFSSSVTHSRFRERVRVSEQ